MDHRTFRIDAGTRVLIVGSTPNDHAWLTAPQDRGPEPWIVFAGSLVEPYVPGSAMLLAPGPMAGSVAARGIVRVRATEYHDGQKVVEIERRAPDELGATRYVVVEDRARVAALLEREMLAWPHQLAAAAYIKKMVKMAYGWAAPWHDLWSAAPARP